MGGLTPSRLLFLAVWMSFIASAESISLRPCDGSSGDKRMPCLRRLQEEKCRRLFADKRLQNMEKKAPEISLTPECDQASRQQKFQLRWSTKGSRSGRRRRYLILLKLVNKEGPTVSCYYTSPKKATRKQRRPAKAGRKERHRRAKRGLGQSWDLELPVDRGYSTVSALVLQASGRKSRGSIGKIERLFDVFNRPAASGHYSLTSNSIEDTSTSPQKIQLSLSKLPKLPKTTCKSIYTDGEYKNKRWPKKEQVNVTQLGANQSSLQNFSIQCSVANQTAGYLIIAEVVYEGSRKEDACICFYFCLSDKVQTGTCKNLSVEINFDVQGNYSTASVGILQGPPLESPKKFFKEKRESDILGSFKTPLGQSHYVVPSPPPPEKDRSQSESCYSWKPNRQTPYRWHVTEGGLLLEAFACPSNLLAYKRLLYLAPFRDHTVSVSEVRLNEMQCAGNLTVPTNDTYGKNWSVMLTWDCSSCPEEAHLNGGRCKSKFLILHDDVTVPAKLLHGKPLVGVEVAVGASGASCSAVIVVMVLLVLWRRKKTQSRRRCRSHISPCLPMNNRVLSSQKSVFIIYWPDHDLHRQATYHLATMIRTLDLDVAIDKDSTEEIRRQKSSWIWDKLNSSSIIIVASSGLVRACRAHKQRRGNFANQTDDIFADIAPSALELLAYRSFNNPFSQQVFLVSFDNDSSCSYDLRNLLYSVSNIRALSLAARPKDKAGCTEVLGNMLGFFCKLTGCKVKTNSGAQSDSANLDRRAPFLAARSNNQPLCTEEVHGVLYEFFTQLTSCKEKAKSAALSDSAMLFEEARLQMQHVREGTVPMQSASQV